MYTKKDFLKLTQDELADYAARGFALCYVERCERLDVRDESDDYNKQIGMRLFFTSIDLDRQWGDDWNDAPYDCNAGWPYDDTNEGTFPNTIRHEHEILVLNVSYEIGNAPTLPEEYGYNTPFCVETINQGACAWMFFENKCKPIYAGDTPLDVLERTGKWMRECPELNDEDW